MEKNHTPLFRFARLGLRHPEMLFAWFRKRLGHAPDICTLYVECSGLCNLDCKFCFNRGTPEALGSMTRKTFSVIARRMFPYVRSVNFVGYGEPLVNKSLPWMIHTTKSYGREAHVTTNGVMLDETLIYRIIHAGTDSIAVSLDGSRAEIHDRNRGDGTFAATTQHMRLLTDIKKSMGVKKPLLIIDTILTREHRPGIPALLHLASELGAATVNVGHLQSYDEATAQESLFGEDASLQNEYQEWREKASSLGLILHSPDECAGSNGEGCFWNPEMRLAVTWDGKIRPCCFLLHSNKWYFSEKSYPVDAPIFGDLLRRSFPSIWNSVSYRMFREDVAHAERWPAACEPCLLRAR